jgi:hypothetical protein
MSDYDSSLPIRTENDGDVVSFIADATTPANKLKVNADGSIDSNVVVPSGTKIQITDGTDDLAVNGDGSLNAVVSATDLDVRDLTFATDKVDASGSLVDVQATDLDIRDLTFATDKVDASGSLVDVQATDLDIRNLTFADDKVDASGSTVRVVDEDGNAFSSANPLPVEFFEAKAETFDFSQGNAIAKNATHTHTYAAPANYKLKEVYVSGSGKLRAELRINNVTVAVGFNSTANPQVQWSFQKGLNASSVNVTVLIENLDNGAQNLYSTLVGLS